VDTVRRVLLMLILLLVCGAGCASRARVSLPCQPEISEAAATRFEEKIRPLTEEEGAGPVALQTTSDEVTSFLTQMVEEHTGEVPVTNPRVCFTPGEIYVAGRFTSVLPFDLEATVVLAPRLVEGRLEIEILEVWAGSLALPKVLLRSLSSTLNETLAESSTGIHVSAIHVEEGQITLSGYR